jgi:hypothetical protein
LPPRATRPEAGLLAPRSPHSLDGNAEARLAIRGGCEVRGIFILALALALAGLAASVATAGSPGPDAVPSGPAGWTRPKSITPPGEAAIVPDLSLDRDGRAVAVWYREAADGDLMMRGASRRPGHGFDPPESIGRADQTSGNSPPSVPEIAIDRRGNAVAVWLRKDDQGTLRVVSSFRPADGEFGSVETLSKPGAPAFDPQVAFARSGKAIAVWSRLVDPAKRGSTWR